jgi:hypothetical protein
LFETIQVIVVAFLNAGARAIAFYNAGYPGIIALSAVRLRNSCICVFRGSDETSLRKRSARHQGDCAESDDKFHLYLLTAFHVRRKSGRLFVCQYRKSPRKS